MKKITLVVLVLSMIISVYSCSKQSDVTKVSLDYYTGMDIPTFDSVTGEKQCISSETNFAFGYGEYASLEKAKASMILYCDYLEDNCNYCYEIFSDYYARIETAYGTIMLASMVTQDSNIIVAISLPE